MTTQYNLEILPPWYSIKMMQISRKILRRRLRGVTMIALILAISWWDAKTSPRITTTTSQMVAMVRRARRSARRNVMRAKEGEMQVHRIGKASGSGSKRVLVNPSRIQIPVLRRLIRKQKILILNAWWVKLARMWKVLRSRLGMIWLIRRKAISKTRKWFRCNNNQIIYSFNWVRKMKAKYQNKINQVFKFKWMMMSFRLL